MPPKKRKPHRPSTPSPSVAPGRFMAGSPCPSLLVTEVNYSLSGKPRVRQSVDSNTESSNLHPALPQSFSSPSVDGFLIPNQQGSSRNAPQKGKEPAWKKPRIAAENMHINQNQYTPQQHLKIQQEQSWVQPHSHQQVYNHLQHQGTPPPAQGRQPMSPALFRLRMYINDLRRRPADNSLEFWCRFVQAYYAPQAKQRWCFSSCHDTAVVEQYAQRAMQDLCFSSYDNVAGCGATKDAWECDLCCANSGKGFEATYENLPRLCQIKFERGLIEEFLKFGKPFETIHPSGIIVLDFPEALLRSNYVQEHTDHKGHLRILFTHDLKILQWDFCVRRHEEFLPRSSLAPQINHFKMAAHAYQSAVAAHGYAGLSSQELQHFSHVLMTTTDLLIKTLEPQSLTGLGLPKGFACTWQMSEVTSSLKDSIDISHNRYIGQIGNSSNSKMDQFQQGHNLPVHHGSYIAHETCSCLENSFKEGLKNYGQQTATTGTSLNCNPGQFKQGPKLHSHPGSYIFQQNGSTEFSNAVHPLTAENLNPSQLQKGLNLQGYPGAYISQQNDNPHFSNAVYPTQSLRNHNSSSMGSSDAKDPLRSGGVRQVWTNLASNTNEVPKQSLHEPSSANATAEGEVAMIRSEPIKNGSGSTRSPTSISNVARGTLLSGNRELVFAAEGNSHSSSDNIGTHHNLQSQEMDALLQEASLQAQEIDDVWKHLGDIELLQEVNPLLQEANPQSQAIDDVWENLEDIELPQEVSPLLQEANPQSQAIDDVWENLGDIELPQEVNPLLQEANPQSQAIDDVWENLGDIELPQEVNPLLQEANPQSQAIDDVWEYLRNIDLLNDVWKYLGDIESPQEMNPLLQEANPQSQAIDDVWGNLRNIELLNSDKLF